ncbi:MAG TPA: methyltransferase domain-containing protein [Stellaceae bacterium]|jgi:arsenite methyltransferase|nr:methyltransferase domain-containing protein [Stellaceae bacterium]
MTNHQPEPHSDAWSDWLLHVRHGGDAEYRSTMRARLNQYADRVLHGARLAAGMTLADIGAGEGLIGFRAIDRIGPSLRVIFTDISAPMLRHAEALAAERGTGPQCAFHHCSAERLEAIETDSVDVVATRAVLAYVADKPAALREFRRILKPGGRISLAEPIFRDEALVIGTMKAIVDGRSPDDEERLLPLMHRWRAAQLPDTMEKISANPITNYTERDLVRFAQACGFTEIHMEFHIDILPFAITSWETFLESSPHPWARPLKVILEEQFTAEERQLLEPALRRVIMAPNSVTIERIAYLTATKPKR